MAPHRPSVYCFATSNSMVSFTSSPSIAVGYLAATPNAVGLMVVVAENPACGFGPCLEPDRLGLPPRVSLVL